MNKALAKEEKCSDSERKDPELRRVAKFLKELPICFAREVVGQERCCEAIDARWAVDLSDPRSPGLEDKEVERTLMQWLIQNSGITFERLDRNVEPLLTALDARHLASRRSVIPFTDIITGLEEIDPGVPTMFYGSTRPVDLAVVSGFAPAVTTTRLNGSSRAPG